jgi:hypothetical protein
MARYAQTNKAGPMKRKSFKKLGIAVAALAFLTLSADTAMSYDVRPESFLKTIQTYIADGDMDRAIALLQKLRAMGVIAIRIDGELITLEELEAMVGLADSQAGIDALVALIDDAVTSSEQVFVFPDQVVLTVASEDIEVFPTSSTG